MNSIEESCDEACLSASLDIETSYLNLLTVALGDGYTVSDIANLRTVFKTKITDTVHRLMQEI